MEEKYIAPEIATGYVLKNPDIAKVGIKREVQTNSGTVYYYDWLTESGAALYVLEETNFSDDYFTTRTQSVWHEDEFVHDINLFCRTPRESASADAVEARLIQLGLSERWVFNLNAMANIAKMVYMQLFKLKPEENKGEAPKS
jgi:hypothetical protein